MTSPLHQAARKGDLRELERLLAAGASVDLPDDTYGHTPLMEACLSPEAGLETLDFLLARGADPNALTCPPAPAGDDEMDADLPTSFEEDLDPDMRAMLEQSRILLRQHRALRQQEGQERPSVLCVAVKSASLEKLRRLVVAGADPAYTSVHGYTAVILAACAQRLDAIELLAAAGAAVSGASRHGESVLSVFSRTADFLAVRRLLELGADPTPLGWTPLLQAVALDTLAEVAARLDDGDDLEATDGWQRTAFLLAVHTGDVEKAELLLARGANSAATGRCGRTALHYPIDGDHRTMLQWLLAQGFDPGRPDDFGHTPLMEAVEQGALACFEALRAAGADWRKGKFDQPLIADATHPAIIRQLLELGEDPGKLDRETLRDWIGLGNVDELPVSEAEYHQGRSRRFGSANPERMEISFWRAMVRCGWTGYQAARQFGDSSFDRNNPVWSHHRHGMSLTPLPDGRFIQIAGEHEDHYDPDFCIYNEVIIHDGKGGFEILGYPEEIFPPTDFHSATRVGEWIYLIGNLGYPYIREAFGGETPVFRFHIDSGRMERVATQGDSPGWIHDHRAEWIDGCIRIRGGKVIHVDGEGARETIDLEGCYSLDLSTGIWGKVPSDP